MSDSRLPLDVSESNLDPEICESCQVLSNRIEDMQDALSDCLEFLIEIEEETRVKEFGSVESRNWRKALLSCIERVKKLA